MDIAYPVNIVGEIQSSESLAFFDALKIGRSIKLEKVQEAIDEDDYL
jgi:hypothetical protein